ncbi:universal stress protein [Schwartzia sp. (in: firmicutes)]
MAAVEDVRYRKILVPLDGSVESERGFRHAVYLASLVRGELTLLHVVDLNRKMSMLERSMAGGYVPTEFKEQGYKLLQPYTKQVPEEVGLDTMVQIGSPADVIVDVAENGGFSIIVLGTRGLGTLQDVILGGVSHSVLHHCSVPVLLVR